MKYQSISRTVALGIALAMTACETATVISHTNYHTENLSKAKAVEIIKGALVDGEYGSARDVDEQTIVSGYMLTGVNRNVPFANVRKVVGVHFNGFPYNAVRLYDDEKRMLFASPFSKKRPFDEVLSAMLVLCPNVNPTGGASHSRHYTVPAPTAAHSEPAKDPDAWMREAAQRTGAAYVNTKSDSQGIVRQERTDYSHRTPKSSIYQRKPLTSAMSKEERRQELVKAIAAHQTVLSSNPSLEIRNQEERILGRLQEKLKSGNY